MKPYSLKKHSVFYFFGKITAAVFAYLTIVLFIRFAGNEEYGKYSLVLSIILFISNFSSGWINQVLLRFRNQQKTNEKKQEFESIILLFILFSLFIGSISLIIFLKNTPAINGTIILIGLIIYILVFIYSISITVLQAQLNSKKYAVIESLRSSIILLLPLIYYMIYRELNSTIIFCSLSVSYFIIILLIKIKHVFSVKSFSIFIKSNHLKEYLMYGVPIGLWLGSMYLIRVTEKFLITYFIDYEASGIYAGVYDIIYKSLSLIFLPILTAAHPLIMNSWNKSKKESINVLKKSLRYELMLLPIVLIGIVIISPILARTISMEITLFFKLSIPIAISTFLWHFAVLLHKPLELNNKTMYMLVIATIALIIGVILNIILIPIFSYIIVAYVSVFTALIYSSIVGFNFLRFISK